MQWMPTLKVLRQWYYVENNNIVSFNCWWYNWQIFQKQTLSALWNKQFYFWWLITGIATKHVLKVLNGKPGFWNGPNLEIKSLHFILLRGDSFHLYGIKWQKKYEHFFPLAKSIVGRLRNFFQR